ncbi:MAG: response regulator [Gammaproteobacteria bacterium]|nr:response regulator [Gammaproteobacteria bacterium]
MSLCKLYRYRDRSYRVVNSEGYAGTDIVIVDADDPGAVSAWRSADDLHPGKPAVLIGASFSDPAEQPRAGRYQLKRTRLSAYLLKTLDAITVRELKYAPELVIGDEADPDAQSPLHQLLGQSTGKENGANGRVLVVDDSLSVRTQMEMCLHLHDLSVHLAENAESALELVESNDYDVIFLDVVLPEMDGYKVCKLLKSKEATRSIPIVMLTGKSSPFNKVRGVMAGCDRYLTKPVDAEELRGVLESYLPELAAH